MKRYDEAERIKMKGDLPKEFERSKLDTKIMRMAEKRKQRCDIVNNWHQQHYLKEYKEIVMIVERKFGFLMDSRWKDVPIEMVDGKEREHFQKFE